MYVCFLNFILIIAILIDISGLPLWLRGKYSNAIAGNIGSIPGFRRFLGKGNGISLQDSYLGNLMD